MRKAISSARLYFLPIVVANATAMTAVLGGDYRSAVLLGISLSFLASFGFLLNDLWDRDVDRVNAPGNFEGSDNRTIRVAARACAAFLCAGLSIGVSLGSAGLLITAGVAIGLLAYSVVLRKMLIWPTLTAALLASSPVTAPMVLWWDQSTSLHWLFAAALAAIIAARETLMDIRDRRGDAHGGRRTLPLVRGIRFSYFVVRSLSVSACLVLLTIASTAPRSRILGASVVALVVAYLVVGRLPSQRPSTNDRAAIRSSIVSSRVAMILVPVFVILLWWD